MFSASNLLLVTQDQGIMAAMAGMLVTILIIAGIAYVVMAISTKKLLEKAGQPGWPGWVPIYNIWRLFEISGKHGAFSLLFLGAVIPIVGGLIVLGGSIFLVKVFGKGGGFAVGLVLLGIVFYPILAFGDSRYQPQAAAESGFPVGPPR